MKRFPLILILSLPLAMSCTHDTDTTGANESLMDASRQELATAVEERDELLALVNEISDCMRQIRDMEKLLATHGNGADENPARHRRIIADLRGIKQILKERRARLTELEKKIEESSLISDDMRNTIMALHRQLDYQTEEIESLQGDLTDAHKRIASLSTTVDSLSDSVDRANSDRESEKEHSARLESELNECHYAVAGKKELREHKILETGFLKKTRLMKDDFDRNFFISADRRHLTHIPLHTSRYKILTNHPSDSYTVTGEGVKTIQITDPAKFWSITDYLVVQTD